MNNVQGILENYIKSPATKFSHPETSEMGYRADLEALLKNIFESINVKRVDHDPKAKERNKPDFIVLKNDVPILYIEAKDIGVSLDKIEKSEQMNRYYGYANLVLTDYVEFRFYRNGLRYQEPIKIASYDLDSRTISPLQENYEFTAKTLIEFTQSHKEPIRSGEHLAKIMGGKAQRIRDNVKQFLATESDKNTELVRVYETIKKLLVHDLTKDSFADMYAQTLVYGLFIARYHDDTEKDFSRQEARDLIPKSNPLLRHFFDHIVGPDFDKRLEYIVNELCEVFSHADVAALMEEYFKKESSGKTQKGPDPVIHFYEDFLKEYDPNLRKKMGAYYTPLPVVNFIVRSVDFLLKKEFCLATGLADTSKTASNLHKVQILDPAAGTGTFISAVIRVIYTHLLKGGQKGRWPTYVHNDLLPRLHGFELMMTPYTIAHLKLSMAFRETGFKYFNQRLGIYLTNSLEESPAQQDLFSFGFAESIAEEAKEESKKKNEKPIMVVIGNPPYSVSSSNKGEWIQNLTKDYKTNLNERNIQPLSDDYIKFIRFAEHFVEKNGSGIVAMITNNSFISGVIHRQMRKHLLETFDEIYILDLHGNSNIQEKAPDGGEDKNVFDIQQGVSINIFLRKESEKKGLGEVYHSDLYGKQADKFNALNKNDMREVKWEKLNYSSPYYFFVPKNFSSSKEYESFPSLKEIFIVNGNGVKTNNDKLLTNFEKKKLLDKLDVLRKETSISEIQRKLEIKDGKYWNTEREKGKLLNNNDKDYREYVYMYRPFDYRWIWYQPNLIEIGRGGASKKVMSSMYRSNYAIIACKQYAAGKHFTSYMTNSITDMSSQPFAPYNLFPIYNYSEDGTREANLKKEIIDEIEKIVGKVSPEDIFDYIYAVLHSPSYREKYKEFLKIDFPRVPYPKDKKQFGALVALGRELREIHLLASPKVSQFITTYPVSGSDTVEKISYKDTKVFINSEQYFGNVPEIPWNFYIGGYQPAQKWLKDRKGRALSNSDIEHYQKIIVALVETDRIMKEIDRI